MADKTELNYYSLKRIDKENAQYNIIFGMRSNGKSFSVEERGIDKYIEKGEQMAIIRRYDAQHEVRNERLSYISRYRFNRQRHE